MPLETGALEILHGVGAVVRRVALLELVRQREAEAANAAICVPERLEAVENVVSGLGEVAPVVVVITEFRRARARLVAAAHHVPDAGVFLADTPEAETRETRLPYERELRV